MSELDVEALVAQINAARERAAKRTALVEERARYERRGEPDRVALVDAELERLAAEGPTEVVVFDEQAMRERARAEHDRKAKIAALIRERR
jgi:hypothetical protein